MKREIISTTVPTCFVFIPNDGRLPFTKAIIATTNPTKPKKINILSSFKIIATTDEELQEQLNEYQKSPKEPQYIFYIHQEFLFQLTQGNTQNK